MLDRLRTFLAFALVFAGFLAVLSIIIYVICLLLDAAGIRDGYWHTFTNPSLLAALGVCFTAIVVAHSLASHRTRAISLQHRYELQTRRLSLYLRLLQILRQEASIAGTDKVDDLQPAQHELFLLGGREVIAAYFACCQITETDSDNKRHALANIILAMRHDLYRRDPIDSDALQIHLR